LDVVALLKIARQETREQPQAVRHDRVKLPIGMSNGVAAIKALAKAETGSFGRYFRSAIEWRGTHD
jgi:hypothetical protein